MCYTDDSHHSRDRDGRRVRTNNYGCGGSSFGETRHIPFQLWNLAKLLATPSAAPALFGGVLLGYVMYDLTDYYLQHANPTTAVTTNLKKSHLNHHFRIQDKGFGVTSSLWDIVFGTVN
ncbi:unnamed protein product [Eruca vesicaria subsp. sativa]|uniref:Fatty acid hydroxylase domain-containing protein n=1 Tax=Eruca vesicaria subsp. sativa TaxID=29727 RepID=A0ABC8JLD1_ERUVS|nr:unnamed protein product [Eruca vesicaria subsp. sativa]